MNNNDALDILDMLAQEDLSQVDTSYPILAGGTYEWRIAEASRETSDSGYTYLLFKCALLTPGALDTNGNPVSPGYQIRNMIGLTPSQKQIEEVGLDAAKENIKKNVVKFLQALGDLTFDPTLEKYKDMTFFAKTRVSKEKEDKKTGQVYPPAAEFSTFIPAEG